MIKFTKPFLMNSLKFSEDEAKLIMKAKKQFPELMDNEGEGFCVDGRKLWGQLKEPQGEFSKWIKRKLLEKNYTENKDYIKVDNFVEVGNLQRPQTDYTLTLNCAKKVAMRENTTEGDLVCDYFILMEKAIRENINWNEVRFPQVDGYKRMCSIVNEEYKKTHDVEKTPIYVYSNNADMLNKALFGHVSKKMKKVLEVEQEDSLRDNLQSKANKALAELQELNGNLILNNMEYATRKTFIETTCKMKFADLKIQVNTVFNDDLNKVA
ncbi:antA/AntB antirepressor family protein [Clostridium beijerinckii]|nr:antA/AntB antirepressor family protein [Clostridium beijerinckii]